MISAKQKRFRDPIMSRISPGNQDDSMKADGKFGVKVKSARTGVLFTGFFSLISKVAFNKMTPLNLRCATRVFPGGYEPEIS